MAKIYSNNIPLEKDTASNHYISKQNILLALGQEIANAHSFNMSKAKETIRPKLRILQKCGKSTCGKPRFKKYK